MSAAAALLPVTPATEYVSAMRAAVTGVNVITTDGPSGRCGLTVSAMSSVSADPPLLLVCVNRRSPLVAAIRANGAFAVNVLGAHQEAVAETFAGRTARRFDFGCGSWQLGASCGPVLAGAAAWFECLVQSTADAGSHTVILGEVLAAGRGAAAPLAHHDGDYATIR